MRARWGIPAQNLPPPPSGSPTEKDTDTHTHTHTHTHARTHTTHACTHTCMHAYMRKCVGQQWHPYESYGSPFNIMYTLKYRESPNSCH